MVSVVLQLANKKLLTIFNDNNIMKCNELDDENIISSVYSLVKDLDSFEFSVIIKPTVIDNDAGHISLGSLKIGFVDRYFCMSKNDSEVLQYLGLELGLKNIAIYNYFSLIEIMGKIKPCIVAGEYLNGMQCLLYVSNEGIQDFRAIPKFDLRVLDSMLKLYNCDVVCEYNNMLYEMIKRNIKNFSELDESVRELLVATCLTRTSSPCLDLKVLDDQVTLVEQCNDTDDFYEVVEDFEDMDLCLDDNEHNLEESELNEESNDEDENDSEIPAKPKKKFLSNILNITGFLSAGILAFSIFANTELATTAIHLQDKATQIYNVLAPLENKDIYLTRVVSSSEDKISSDVNYVRRIKDIQFKGVVAEVQIHNNDVNTVIYAETTEASEQFTKSLDKHVRVRSAEQTGDVEVEGKKYLKFEVHANIF